MNLLFVLHYVLTHKILIARIGAALIILLTFVLGRNIATNYIFNMLLKIIAKTTGKFADELTVALKKPTRIFFVMLGAYLCLAILPFPLPNSDKIFRSAVIILIAMALRNIVDSYALWFFKIEKMLNIEIDKILVPFLSKVLRLIIVMFAVMLVAQEWNYDINGFIAGLGLGGLAFALAAKDTAANIFGGIVIIMDKPFSIGDWVYTPSVEGTVETINFRSTKVRTFDQALVTVPNATLVNEPITNWSRMGKRRITFNLGVKYDTPKEKLQNCISEIRSMLKQNPKIHHETIHVTFNSFNENSLDIFLYFFTTTTDWGKYLQAKEEINFRIMEILEGQKVSMAFPSTSVYFENSLETMLAKDSASGYSPLKEHKQIS